jgi:CubicO group peptidase (beta-lactamase class C family)
MGLGNFPPLWPAQCRVFPQASTLQLCRAESEIIMEDVDCLMRHAITGKVFPGAVLLVSQEDAVRLHRAYGVADLATQRAMTLETVFDLASLTKPLATALAVMVLVQAKKINLEQDLGEILPAFTKNEKSFISIKQLLYHSAGLPDYRAYYRDLEHLPLNRRKKVLRKLLVAEPLVYPAGSRVVYSDLGFMILEWVVEQISGQRLDRFVRENIYRPMGLDRFFFVDLSARQPQGPFAATEQCPWRQEMLCGKVHDENAYVVGGIQGHAGLFGTAASVHTLLASLLSAYRGRHSDLQLEKDLVRLFFRRWPGTDKALGFDAPAAENSSCGRYFSKTSVGHLGFTGTSFWMDLERAIIVILLTNRVHPSRKNETIRVFRPKLHDAVMQCLMGDVHPATS